MAHTFNPGDVVQLKSGGPAMTVVKEITDADYPLLDCRFFKNGEFDTVSFRPEELQPYNAANDPTKIRRM